MMKIPAEFELELAQLFGDMDSAYEQSAVQAGFVCNGCPDNCCRTRFYHHTVGELLYLRAGLADLSPEIQRKIRDRAARINKAAASLTHQGEVVPPMCPLNNEGRCMLYTYRPMICRLHGIPHTLCRPNGCLVTGPGCHAYYAQCPQIAAAPLDRTPLYTAMADLERRLRQQLQFGQRLKLTIAEMVLYEIY